MISFTIPGAPVPKGRPRFTIIGKGRGAQVRTYTPPETEAAERALRLQALRYRPRKPFDGALRVDTIFVVAAPQKFPEGRSHEWPHVVPDDDNYRKLVLDAIKGLFWHDDGQICGGESYKIYGHPPRTWIRIRPLTTEDAAMVRELLGEMIPQRTIFGG